VEKFEEGVRLRDEALHTMHTTVPTSAPKHLAFPPEYEADRAQKQNERGVRKNR
jgi:hypothetical protein